jgi:MYXO-CTERM domain-containing protein
MPTRTLVAAALLLLPWTASAGPEAYADEHEHEPAPYDDPAYWSDAPSDPSLAIDCQESKDTGYVKGDPFEITVVHVDGKPVEVETANAFYQMVQAAAADGVNIKVVSGFRTMAEQEYLYACYVNCNCNNCNLAAKPGYSNHQSGHALDLNTGASGVYNWLATHGDEWGFSETVPSEDWHWEWWGGGPPASGPCGVPDYRAEYVAQSFPLASQPPVVLSVGEALEVSIDLANTGDKPWTATTRLAPTPRDVASPLADAGWLSPTRIAAPQQDTPPGQVGRFAFRVAANAPGDYFQTFGLVEEGVTWFSDPPLGGGPPDDQLEIHVVVIDPAPPLPPPEDATTGGEAGEAGGEAGSGEGEGGGEAESGAPTGSGGETSSGGEAPGPGPDASGGAGGEDDAGCGCRGGEAPGLAGLAALALIVRRRRRA